MLIGYSFGADTLPFAYPLLPRTFKSASTHRADGPWANYIVPGHRFRLAGY